ncbi:GntR family transcriptional regulator [Streptomyces sp. NBC_00878]|uniref:GntR family transcriptional regulator n=1 Tax=Streptomyces sp. NBC_00878 TaxID=2975854 RepID=UPI002255BE85|nr:GntR family transcriptional regulator [Streptomyces sp. NBC_00878]MCX4907436.1 GntR family transcriptional regulator [Streptomyces sp. NBC_00878]
MLQRVTAVQALTEELRRQILSGDLPPGSKLPEVGLAEQFNVARPTVRTAVQHLVERGVLRRDTGRSAVVPELSGADVRDVYFAREAVELHVVDHLSAPGRSPQRLRQVRQAMEHLQNLSADAPWSEVAEADLAFHTALVEAAESTRLDRLFHGLLEEVRMCLVQLEAHYPRRADLADEHRRILDALETQDAAVARKLMRAHLDSAVRALTDD